MKVFVVADAEKYVADWHRRNPHKPGEYRMYGCGYEAYEVIGKLQENS